MRKGKAAGSDIVPGEVYKLVENEENPTSNLAKILLKLLNDIFNWNKFPEEWRYCCVVPIFKKGDKRDLNNYRGIALINTLLTVITKILAERMQIACIEFNILNKEQMGFIKNEECVAQAACLIECCQRRSAFGQNTILCFLDLKKAYDMVPHDSLFSKLELVGLGTKLISFIKRMYDNTYM